jgi:phospholipid/cholesterol/gamma-HCH transport system substrate-binding protein
LKFQKEIKAGVIAVVSITLLVLGINFLKGSSFFGGDDTYHSFFENTNQLMVASDVTLNGVIIGKVIDIQILPQNTPNRRVKVSFNIQNKNIKISRGSTVEIGSSDFFSKGLILKISPSNKKKLCSWR